MLNRFTTFFFCSLFFMASIFFIPKMSCQEVGKIAAVVNDHIISVNDLEARIKLALISSGLEDTAEARKSLQDQLLQSMINEILQKSTAEKFDIKASEPDVLRAFADLENRNNMQPGQMKEILKFHTIPLESMFNQIRAQLSWRDYIQEKYSHLIQISPQDVDQAMKQSAVKKDKPQFLLAEIFLSVDNSNDDDKVRQKANEFVAEIRKGTSFMALAQQFSQNASAARGGDIGWLTNDQLDPNLSSSIQSLDLNQVTDPIKTPTGYYIVLLRDRRAPGESIGKDTLMTFTQVLFPVSQPYTDEKLEPIFAKANGIVNNATGCGLLKKLASGDSSIQIKEIQKAHLQDMAPQLKDLLLKLPLGKANEPILSDLGFIVFMMCEKEDINPDNPTSRDVQASLFEKKLEQMAQRELRDVRRTAEIDIRL